MKINDIEKIHPMKQVAVMSIVQIGMFGFMLLIFYLINLVVE